MLLHKLATNQLPQVRRSPPHRETSRPSPTPPPSATHQPLQTPSELPPLRRPSVCFIRSAAEHHQPAPAVPRLVRRVFPDQVAHSAYRLPLQSSLLRVLRDGRKSSYDHWQRWTVSSAPILSAKDIKHTLLLLLLQLLVTYLGAPAELLPLV